MQAERAAILAQYQVPTEPFSALALAELPTDTLERPWAVTAEEAATRRDLRGTDTRIASIDPPGCVDVDDALSVRRLPSAATHATGGQAKASAAACWEVGVHIADVSHFVREGGALDQEAQERGTTVYLIDQRVDMLPALLR